MVILYLYTEVMGYTLSTISSIVEYGNEVHVVHWDKKKLTPYKFKKNKKIKFYPRSKNNKDAIQKLCNKINPDIIAISGWMDPCYLKIAKSLIKKNKKVVCMFDDQWLAKPKQYIAKLLGKFGFFHIYFSNAWVCGSFQYEYARKLGFRKDEIIYDLYSADIELFKKVKRQRSILIQKSFYPKYFYFIGRLENIKGIKILINAWAELGHRKKDWKLKIIGNGALKEFVKKHKDIILMEFMQPDNLIKEIIECGCFILPSNYEPWGVVVHEAATAGMPLILSDAVGARASFLVNGMNGYKFKSNSTEDLKKYMLKIINSDEKELIKKGELSFKLSQRITPETSAKNLLSIAN